ncbi:uncharacterized [Tachysurus ichikawai]
MKELHLADSNLGRMRGRKGKDWNNRCFLLPAAEFFIKRLKSCMAGGLGRDLRREIICIAHPYSQVKPVESGKWVGAVILASSERLITVVKLLMMWSDRDLFCHFRGGNVSKMMSVITPGQMLLPQLRMGAQQEADGEFDTM